MEGVSDMASWKEEIIMNKQIYNIAAGIPIIGKPIELLLAYKNPYVAAKILPYSNPENAFRNKDLINKIQKYMKDNPHKAITNKVIDEILKSP